MYSEILKLILTEEEKNDMLISINKLLLSLDQHGLTVEELVNKSFSLKVARSFDLAQVSADPKAYFEGLAKSIEELEVLGLEVAVEPTGEMMQKIYDWVLTNLGKQVILDVSINPVIIAGAKISFNGKFIDNSLEKSLAVWRSNSHAKQN
jgi:F0F1-type ATP synthase delta subunit